MLSAGQFIHMDITSGGSFIIRRLKPPGLPGQGPDVINDLELPIDMVEVFVDKILLYGPQHTVVVRGEESSVARRPGTGGENGPYMVFQFQGQRNDGSPGRMDLSWEDRQSVLMFQMGMIKALRRS